MHIIKCNQYMYTACIYDSVVMLQYVKIHFPKSMYIFFIVNIYYWHTKTWFVLYYKPSGQTGVYKYTITTTTRLRIVPTIPTMASMCSKSTFHPIVSRKTPSGSPTWKRGDADDKVGNCRITFWGTWRHWAARWRHLQYSEYCASRSTEPAVCSVWIQN